MYPNALGDAGGLYKKNPLARRGSEGRE